MKLKRWGAVLLAIWLWIGVLTAPMQAENLEAVIDRAAAAQCGMAGAQQGALLENRSLCPAGENLSDWVAFTLAQTGQDEDFSAYCNALEHHVTQQYMQEQSGINGRHRIILTVLALGGDPTAFGTAADGTAIDLVADTTWQYAGDFSKETLNVPAYALIVWNAGGYTAPADARYSREELVQIILAQQNADGGFGLMQGTSDVDITAMVLQGFAPLQDDPAVQTATGRALDYLAGAMDANGTYTAYGTDSSESLSQVILALCALGITPDGDDRFGTPTQVLLQYCSDDGSFRHALADENGDYMATQQAMLALEAVDRLEKGEPGVFALQDSGSGQHGLSNKLVIVICVLTAAAVLSAAIIVIKRGKKDV